YLPDSNLVARRVAPLRGRFVASPEYIRAHGAPRTPDELLDHEAVMQGTEPWRVVNDGRITTVGVRGRFKADNGEALTVAALAGIGIAALPTSSSTSTSPPARWCQCWSTIRPPKLASTSCVRRAFFLRARFAR